MIEGPVTVFVNNSGLDKSYAIVDYAGYKVFKTSRTFDYVKDTSVPVVTVKSANHDKVVLGFSKPVKGTNIKLYHTVINDESREATATETDYTDEITFTYDKKTKDGLRSGSVKLFLVNSDEDDDYKLVDAYGIKVPDQTLICEIALDENSLVFTSGSVENNVSIELTFSEELDKDTAENKDNYRLKRVRDNKEISFSIKIDPDKAEKVTLLPDSKLEDNTGYEVLILDAQDIYGNKISRYYTFNFTTLDLGYPVVINDPRINPHCFAKPQKGEITIVFSEPMNEAQMLDKGNYMVSLNGDNNSYKALGNDDSVRKVDDRTVRIYCRELENKNDPTIRPYVKIAPIMDLAGNRLNNSINAYTVESIGGLDPAVVTVKSAKEDKVVLGFSKPVKGSHIKLYFDYGNESYVSDVSKSDYTNEITFRFSRLLPVGNLKLFLVNSQAEDEKLVDIDYIYVPDQSLVCEVEETPNPTPTPTRNPSTHTKTPTRTPTNPPTTPPTTPPTNPPTNPPTTPPTATATPVVDQTCPELVTDPENIQYCCTVPEEGFIYIVFSEAMNEDQMLDKENYQVSIDEGENYITLGDDAITKVNESTVRIYFEDIKDKNIEFGVIIAPWVKIAPITDLAGNKLYGTDEPYVLEGIEPEYVCINEAYLIASNKIKIIFNKEMETVELSDILIQLTTQDLVYATGCESNTVNSLGQTEVVLELPIDEEGGAGEPIYIYTAENTSSASKWGSKLVPGDSRSILKD